MKEFVSIKEASLLLEISRQAVESKIKKGCFKTSLIPSLKQKGKTVTEIAVSSLSVEAQKKLISTVDPSINALPDEPLPVNGLQDLIDYQNLPPQEKARIDARIEILMDIRDATASGKKADALESACAERNISVRTYYRWDEDYKRRGLAGLADKRFGQSRSKLTQAQKNYIIALIKQNPDRRNIRIYEFVNKRFPLNQVSGATVSRFVKRWKTEKHELFTYLKNPDLWKSQYWVSFGSHSEKARHFLHYVELDSTPADVLCADGKRYSIIGAIDIFSRKARVHVSPTSSGRGIAALFRSIILNWGIPETIVRDNGKDYTGNHIDSILNGLKIGAVTVPPFSPEGKPHIERFFGTLTRGLFEEIAGYIGHNVAQRKAIESRRSFAQRFMQQGKDPVHLNLMPDELLSLVTSWIENVYHQTHHKGIGTTPELKAAQSEIPARQVPDERALDILLMPAGEATVQKKGIHYQNAVYQSPALAGWMRQRVQVRRDVENAGRLYIFDLEGQYITTAWDRAIEGMPSIDYESIRRGRLKNIREQKAAIEVLNEDPMLDLINSKKQQKSVVGLPRRRKVNTRELDEARTAALDGAGIKAERFKSVAEQMRERAGIKEDRPRAREDDDPFFYMEDFKIVNS